MPVRSLTPLVFTWPEKSEVDAAVREWASRMAASKPEILRIGYFGSYARGDAGVGSDLDVIALVTSAVPRTECRRRGWDTTLLPVPVDLLVYTDDEFARLPSERLSRVFEHQTVWIYVRDRTDLPATSR